MTSEIKNKNGKPKPEHAAFKSGTFINHTFSADDKGRFKEWAASALVELGGWIDRLLEDGYKLSVKYDDFTSAYACFIQPISERDGNAGFILTGRSRSGSMAILAGIYRHYVIFEAQWPVRDARPGTLDDE